LPEAQAAGDESALEELASLFSEYDLQQSIPADVPAAARPSRG
jgi:hypothetical protein